MREMREKIIMLGKNFCFAALLVLAFSYRVSECASMGDYCYIPPFVMTSNATVPPNVMIMLSIETPMQGAAHPDIICTGDPTSSYSCSFGSCSYVVKGYRVNNCYDNSKEYYGYFAPNKCYDYKAGGVGGRFEPESSATNHQCSGSSGRWSGNFLNWATMTAIDTFRKAMTGGNRDEDSTGNTQLLGARQTLTVGHNWFPIKRIDDAENYTPYSGIIYLIRRANGFVVCRDTDNDGLPDCGISESGSGEKLFPSVSGKRCSNDLFKACDNDSDCAECKNKKCSNDQSKYCNKDSDCAKCDNVSGNVGAFNLEIKVCEPSKGLEPNCNPENKKPEGVIQKYANKIRFGLISYALHNNPDKKRDGGIIRANIKWLSSKIPYGMKYHDANGDLVTCKNPNGCPNPEKEINEDGTFITNPDNIGGNVSYSGVINYINKFGYESGYKIYDPISEMYYEIIRYFKGRGPTSDYCSGLQEADDGAPVYCSSSPWSHTNRLGWRDPYIYWCQRSYVLAINDANPWLDKRIPGTSKTSDSPCKQCVEDYGAPSNADSSIDVSKWTDDVGEIEGITPGNMCIGCVLNGDCDWNANQKYVSKLSKAFGTCPYPSKENSYYIAGLAYYAHQTDLRSDLYDKQSLKTYMIDTQEANPNMLVGRTNMLYLAAKFGNFDDKNGDGKPNDKKEWDKNDDGFPDAYFFASDPARLEKKLTEFFEEMLDRVSSGTTVVALPPSSTVEASVLARAYFYPEKTYESGTVKWIGELSTLWFHSIRENTDNTGESETEKILDIMKDYPLAFVFNPNTSLYEGYVYNDLNSDGEPKSCSSTKKKLEDIIPIFASGSMLVQRDPNNRVIRTAIDSDNDGKISSSEVKNFDPEDSILRSRLQTYWSYDDLGICNDDCAKSVIKYIRGYDKPDPSGASFRLRQSDSTTINNKATFKLGDIIYSTPKIAPNTAVNGYDVKYNDSTYSEFVRNTIKNQTPIIIVGANDGMIHAFRLGGMKDIVPPTNNNGGKQVTKLISCSEESTTCSDPLGKEEWSYIPYNVLPYLRWYCQESYGHIPMLETTFTIVDASIGSPGNSQTPETVRDKDSWRRLLIAQMGLGGTPITVGGKTFSSSIIVMDITDHLNPVLLWEQPLPDRTLTFATPGIVRLGDGDKNGQWYLVIGSGPTAITTTSLSYPASSKIYVFDLKTGELKATLSIPDVSNQAVGDILSTDLDLPMGDYNVDDLYFGTYNDSSGALYRLRIRDGSSYLTDPNQWKITRIINVGRPVFAAPAVAHDENGMRWLYFGTGIYLTASHAIPTDEKFFGLIEPDECWTGSGSCNEVTEADLLDTTNTAFTGGKAEQYVCQCPGGIQISSGYCTIESNGSVDCPESECPSEADRVITEVRDAVFSGVAGCNGLTKLEAIECVQRKIYEYGNPPYKKGWKRNLAGEKLYSSPVVVGGALLATPFKPTDDVCSAGGNTTMLALYYTTGTPYYQPLIRAPGGTEGEPNNLTIKPEVVIAVGPPPTKTSIVLRQHEDTVTALTQVSGGVISTEIRNPMAVKDKCFQWIVK